jgi:hypothetical protein
LSRRLGAMQTTAWKIKTKLVEAMRLVSTSEQLDGREEMDDAYLGGERSGGKIGRGSPGKKPIVVAVQTDEMGRPRRIKLRRIARSERRRVKSLTKRIVAPAATVVTNGHGSTIGTALTLTPFGERVGAASALLGFMQMVAAPLRSSRQDPCGIAVSRIVNRAGDNDGRGAGLLLALATSDRVGPYFDFRDHRRMLLCRHHCRLHSICLVPHTERPMP